MQLSSPWIDTNSFWHTHTHSNGLKKIFDFLFVTFWHDDPRKKRHTTIHVCLLTPQINWIKIKLVYSIFLFSSIERSSCLWNWFICCIVFFIKVPLNLIFFSRKEWIYLISIFTKWQFYHKGFSNGYFMCMNNWNGITCIQHTWEHTYICPKNLQNSCTPVCQRKEQWVMLKRTLYIWVTVNKKLIFLKLDGNL